MKLKSILLFVLVLYSNAFADETSSTNKDKLRMYFNNTAYYEYYSTDPNSNMHNNQTEIINPGFSVVSEKFESFIYLNKLEKYFSGKLFWGIDLGIEKNENYSQEATLGFKIGIGNYKKPYFIWEQGLSYQKDLIFNNGTFGNSYVALKFGGYDDLHAFIYFEGGWESHRDTSCEYLQAGILDVALGWKDFSPFFAKLIIETYSNFQKTLNPNQDMFHETAKSLIHIQYNKDNYSLSAGCTFYRDAYGYDNYDANNYHINSTQLEAKQYAGGGITFDLKNFFDQKLNIFGEFHLLGSKDNSPKYMIISKVGTKLLF